MVEPMNKQQMDEMEALAVRLAIGRIFRILSRPYRDGDVQMYEQCKSLILDLCPEPGIDHAPNWAKDRLKGAQGD